MVATSIVPISEIKKNKLKETKHFRTFFVSGVAAVSHMGKQIWSLVGAISPTGALKILVTRPSWFKP